MFSRYLKFTLHSPQMRANSILVSLVSRFLPETNYAQRVKALENAGYNLFNVPTNMISGGDYLTDSGTGGLLDTQRSAMELADEAYAGSSSYRKFEEIFKKTTGYKHIFPVHQGRAAEKVLFGSILGPKSVVFSNSLFDTTRAHVEHTGATGVDLVIPEALDIAKHHPFKGNINIEELKRQIPLELAKGNKVGCCIITVTNNTGGGQPVSLANIRAAKEVLAPYKIPLIIDACRIAENAYFIKERELKTGYSIQKIIQEIFAHADGFTMSAKKDGIANMGGVLGFNNDEWVEAIKPAIILNEGFLNYGGMSGRDMEAVAEGFKIAMTETYLKNRIGRISYLAKRLKAYDIPMVEPHGGHAIYVDARNILPHIPCHEFPGQSLSCAVYLVGGIRSCEMGSIVFGRYDDPSDHKKLTKAHKYELVRFAIPRLMYDLEAFDHLAETLLKIKEKPELIPGMVYDVKPKVLPHFSATFRPLGKLDLSSLVMEAADKSPSSLNV